MALPKVSFVIINYNYGRYIAQAISSILSQDYAGFECVVLDNNSTDSSRDVVRQFENSDERLHIEYLDRNLNQMGGFLHVIDRLSGGWSVSSMPTISYLRTSLRFTSSFTSIAATVSP
ncbi:glycosyltransferase family 2 protein [Mesorhizobium sp. B2-8-3]|uniref:glycosyltransferase family 2 protein n=1 Tax=Mesorhizobium sp. B2-8-3 TaxID=2589905 RepID=UPI00112754E0|nr:glycosyltransferase family 2 protein [Mesorhizobium sp. B2-8-3]TPJ32863.1 glycosyltransferase family 2 protein [Mesorhizobium sp. B2-8-3]